MPKSASLSTPCVTGMPAIYTMVEGVKIRQESEGSKGVLNYSGITLYFTVHVVCVRTLPLPVCCFRRNNTVKEY